MAKVSLRVYNREIEGMVEGGHLDEAVAHCQHVLKTFPMHIETYRLLGKTFLEARRYADAADIFQRVLMVVPDDFVSHVGMSIIRDDEGKLDEAIWHMERAFEVQPSNPAIQGELRRLFGRRDGVEPPKIRLSRDALANMYSQGELFNQAIAEIRTILAEDPNRPDLQVMLARAYYRGGQKVEAAEMAANLLKKYPYCLDALRILAEVLPGTARADNTQVYRTRLCLLDPYSSFVTGSVFASDQVADAAVNLERLDYKPGAMAPSQPEWASSLGIKLDGEKRAEPVPEWLAGGEPSAGALPESVPSPAEPAAAQAQQDVPDWMRAAGWQESSAAVQEGPADLEAEPAAEPLAQAEIPDWLKSMAPAEVNDAAPDETPAGTLPSGGDVPDWLAGLGAAGTTAASASTQPPAAGDIPDWLAGPGTAGADSKSAPESIPAPAEPAPLPAEPAATGGDVPDWLAGLSSEENDSQAQSAESDGLPDWLKDVGTGAGAAAAAAASPQGTSIPKGKPMDQKPPAPSASEKPVSRPTTQPRAKPAVPPAAESSPMGKPAPRTAAPVPQPPATSSQGTSLPKGKPAASGRRADDDVPFQPTGEAKPLNIEDDAFAWLESLAAKQGAKPEELLTNPDQRSDEIPASLRQEPPAPAATEFPKEKPAVSDAEEPPLAPTGPTQPVGITDDTMAWLEGLAARQGAKPEELLTNPDDRSDVPPEWVQKAGETPAKPVPIEPAAIPEPESSLGSDEELGITGWLSRLDAEEPIGQMQKPAAAEPAPAGTDLPDWLKDLDKPTPAERPAQPAGREELPDWLRHAELPPAAEAQPSAPQPAVPEPAPEPELPAWMDANVPIDGQAAPTAPEEWVPAEEKPAEAQVSVLPPAAAPASFDVPAQPAAQESIASSPVLKATGMLSRVPIQDKDADVLASAQKSLDTGHLNEAMQAYTRLIKKNRLLDEVIHDLREAIYRYPVDIIIWQTLGDAYMRANRLQDALDAYTKAEELLR